MVFWLVPEAILFLFVLMRKQWRGRADNGEYAFYGVATAVVTMLAVIAGGAIFSNHSTVTFDYPVTGIHTTAKHIFVDTSHNNDGYTISTWGDEVKYSKREHLQKVCGKTDSWVVPWDNYGCDYVLYTNNQDALRAYDDND